MKKILLPIIGVLIVSSSFGQFVGLNSLRRSMTTSPVLPYTWDAYLQPVVSTSKDITALDATQCHVEAIVDTGTHWYLYYLGSNTTITNPTNGLTDVDQVHLAIKEKNNDVRSGWSKHLGGDGKPAPVLTIGSTGAFDHKQLFARAVLKEGTTYKMWYIGQDVSDLFRVGYATSSDGINWTKYAGNPVYSDFTGLAVGVTIIQIFKDTDDNKYKMLYCGNELGDNICMAESTDGITWTKLRSGILSTVGLGWVTNFQKYNGEYYIWAAADKRLFSGISKRIDLYKTSDFVTFNYLGPQITYRDGGEYGITGMNPILTKPDGTFFMVHTVYRNHIHKTPNLGEEFNCIKVAELDRTDIPIAGSVSFSYPANVLRHYRLSPDTFSGTNTEESITGSTGSLNTLPTTPWVGISSFGGRTLDFFTFNGSQTATFPPISGLNTNNFGVKLRVSLTLTGTHELFRIGNDILITLESGNLRVRLSSDGVSYQKDYISIADISKPNSTWVDDHLYVGFTFNNGTLKLYNDFNEFTTTKTVDTALTNVNTSGASVIIGQNSTVKMRSVTIMSGQTDQQFIDLEI